MSYTPTEQAAIDRLKTKYNSNAYNPATNPGGFANDGHQVNFPAALADTGNAAAAVGVKADEVGTNKIATDTARAAAEQAQAGAATHLSNAEAAKAASEAARDVATIRKTEAEAARDIANTKKVEAEAARDAAAMSETNSAAHEAESLAAKIAAEAARDVATTQKTETEAARDAASASATASANSAAASDSFADDAALSAGASANSATASESSRQVAVGAKNDALAALAAANLPTPIINDRMLVTEGGAYAFKDRVAMNKLLGAPVFDTVYAGGTIGVADHGKSYVVDIATVPTFSIADVATLPTGWSISIRATGLPTAFQSAKLQLGTGSFLYCGNGHGTSFYLFGNGEELKLTKIASGHIDVHVIGQPYPMLQDSYNTGGSGWNSGNTSWLSTPTNYHAGTTTLWNSVSGAVGASGVYSLRHQVKFSVQVASASGYAYIRTDANGYLRSYQDDLLYSGDYRGLSSTTTVRLEQGQTLITYFLMGSTDVYYSPFSGDTRLILSLISR